MLPQMLLHLLRYLLLHLLWYLLLHLLQYLLQQLPLQELLRLSASHWSLQTTPALQLAKPLGRCQACWKTRLMVVSGAKPHCTSLMHTVMGVQMFWRLALLAQRVCSSVTAALPQLQTWVMPKGKELLWQLRRVLSSLKAMLCLVCMSTSMSRAVARVRALGTQKKLQASTGKAGYWQFLGQ